MTLCCSLHLLVCACLACRSALQAALTVSQHHTAAVKAWSKSSSTSSSNSSSSSRHAPQVPLHRTYHADPLSLSPLAHMPYLFMANARRMLADNSSEAGTEVSDAAAYQTYMVFKGVASFALQAPGFVSCYVEQ